MEAKRYYATGRRKTAVARVWISAGSGKIKVNGREIDDYFPVFTYRRQVLMPFEATNTQGNFDIFATVRGGGISGQAGAVRHGIARALEKVHPEHRQTLKKARLLTRDPRMKERKKYGQRGARARFQFSKR